jgi:hypothetical protein
MKNEIFSEKFITDIRESGRNLHFLFDAVCALAARCRQLEQRLIVLENKESETEKE